MCNAKWEFKRWIMLPSTIVQCRYGVGSSTEEGVPSAMKLRILIFFSYLLTLSHAEDCRCGVPSLSRRIINGRPSQPFAYPWVVFVEKKSGFTSGSCTGSVVSPNFVMTAAHCVPDDFNPRVMTVYTWQGCGKASIYSGPSYKVRTIFRNPNFKWKMGDGYDVALLQLTRPIGPKEEVMPICLTERTAGFEDHIVAGWGMQSNGWYKVESECLNEAHIGVISGQECKRIWTDAVLDRVMCAGGETGVCQGDSGGPLMGRQHGLMFQVGISSHTRNDCGIATRTPGVFERVYHHVDWIKKVTGEDGVCVK